MSSSSSNKSELEKAFKTATSVNKMLKTFETMASASCFKHSELAEYCWSITQTLVQLVPPHNPEQVYSFGKTAFTILNNLKNIGNKIDNAHSHRLSLFVSCLCYLFGTACYGLKRYDESLRYLDSADRNSNELEKDVRNCFRHVLIAIQQQLYNVKVAMGKKDEAVVHASKALMFKEFMIDGNCIELGNAYIEAYEAYVAAMDAKEALPLCLKALEIYTKCHGQDSEEVALLRVDLAVLYRAVGEYEKATEQKYLWQSVLENTDISSDFLKAELKGATMLINFGMYKEAIDVLEVVVSRTDTEEGGRVSSFLTMATASCMLEKFGDAENYMRAAERILEKNEIDPIFVGIVYLDMSGLYEKMNDLETALSLSKRVWEMSVHHQEILAEGLKRLGHQKLLATSSTRLFSLISLEGRAEEETLFLIDVVEKLEQIFGRGHIEVGYGCMKFGAALINSGQDDLAVKLIENAKYIMDVALGPHHVDSLRTSHALSEIYAKLGRYNEAAEIQVKVVEDIKGLKPSEQQFIDKAVRLLNKLREIDAKSPTSASSQSHDSKDVSAEKSECETSGDRIRPMRGTT